MSFNKPSMNGLNHFSIEEVNEDIANLETTKQNLLTAGSNINIVGNQISATDTNDVYTAGTNVTIVGNQISSTDTNDVYTAGTNVTIVGNQISATDTNTEYTAGSNISITGNEISSTDTNTEYNSGDGIDVTGSTIKLDLSTVSTSTPQTLPTGFEIITNQDTGLLLTTTDNTSQSARMVIRGRRPSSTTENHAELQFKNNDRDLTSPNDENILGSIVGRVSNSTTNVGGILLNNFTDGQIQTTAMNMSSNGNFAFGDNDTFQNTYKMKVNGSTNLSGLNYIKPNMVLMGFDKDNIISPSGNVWGNGSRQTAPRNKREIGESFSTENDGIITFTKSGYYRIRVTANTQSEQYNNRLAFMNYLSIKDFLTQATTSYDENENFNFFGWGYIRNTSDGGHASCTFEDYIFLNVGDLLQVNQKLDINNLSFDDTLPASNIDQFLNLHIERIYDIELGS